MKRLLGSLVLLALTLAGQSFAQDLQAARSAMLHSINVQLSSNGVGFAELNGDTLVIHSNRADATRFATFNTAALQAALRGLKITQLVYTDDKDQKFIWNDSQGTAPTSEAVVQGQQAETLVSVKQKYLNQRVIVTGYETPAFSGKRQDVLMEWHPAKEHGDGYRYDILANLPATYKGQTATVVAIMPNNKLGAAPTQKVNALGEVISPDQAVNPYFDLVVKFDDGKLAVTTGYPNTISLQLQLASAHDLVTQNMAANLPGIVGKTLYAAGYSHLYQPDSSLTEMRGPANILKQLPITAVHPLDPLQVTAAKYIDTDKVVILKLQLPNGSEALTLALGDLMPQSGGAFLEKLALASGLLSGLPTGLSAEELNAVKNRMLVRGMSTTALQLALGFAKEENDWGNGGKQLIFSEGFLVYVNNEDKVSDWQILNTE